MHLECAVPVLTFADVAAAVAEYRSALGLEVVMDHGWIETPGSARGPQLSVMSRDAAYGQVRAAGVEIVHPLQDEDWGVRRFFLRVRDEQIVNVLSHAG